MYATRRIKDAFRENKDISDPEKIKVLVQKAEGSLEIMKRQVFVCVCYMCLFTLFTAQAESCPWILVVL